MASKKTHALKAVVLWSGLALCSPALAQGPPRGWPETAAEAAAAAARAAVEAKPAGVVRSSPKASVSVARVESAPALAPRADRNLEAAVAEVVRTLQGQTEILNRLVGEFETQRALLLAQQQRLAALGESRVAPAAANGPADERAGRATLKMPARDDLMAAATAGRSDAAGRAGADMWLSGFTYTDSNIRAWAAKAGSHSAVMVRNGSRELFVRHIRVGW